MAPSRTDYALKYRDHARRPGLAVELFVTELAVKPITLPAERRNQSRIGRQRSFETARRISQPKL